MKRLQRIYYTAQALGWENLPRRVWQALKARAGVNRRRLPGGELSAEKMRAEFVADYEPKNASSRLHALASRFFFQPEQRAALAQALRTVANDDVWDERVTHVVDDLHSGRMVLFNHISADIGAPPRFNRDPLHQVDWPTRRHWTTYDQFNPDLADLKCVWEASRFSWAYTLARHYVRSSDASAADFFWDYFDEWDRQNPYGLTPQWSCGQEGTFRLLAMQFAAFATQNAASADARRLHRLSELAWYTGRHIERNINYARGQKNNHALSEAAGLLTIGLLHPELRRAATWAAKGRAVLESDFPRQTYSDGSYVQHSLNYHRVMLDDMLWAARLAEVNGEPLSGRTLERLAQALNWLLKMIEPETGRVPNYGANDGALVLPLSTSDYLDFRPTAQAVNYLLHRKRCFPPGPWDEKMLWLFGVDSLSVPVVERPRKTVAAPSGGYYTFKGESSWAMIRCHSYRDRPSQADMLHFDLWHGGRNVLRDAGSYHYYCRSPWQEHFYSTAAHNTVAVDDADQMIKGPRFLWLRWTRSRLIRYAQSDDDRMTYFEGEHYGYSRLPGKVVHRRSVCRIDDAYVIVDDLLGGESHELTLRWRLLDADWKKRQERWAADADDLNLSITIHSPAGFSEELLRGQESPKPEGWESLYYAERRPVPVLRVSGVAQLPVRLATIVSLDGDDAVRIQSIGDCMTPLEIGGMTDDETALILKELTAGKITSGLKQ